MNNIKCFLILCIVGSMLLATGCIGQERLTGKIAATAYPLSEMPGGWMMGTANVYVVDADNPKEQSLVSGSPDYWRCPRWSPGGDYLALVAWDHGSGSEDFGPRGVVLIFNSDGSFQRRLRGDTNSCAAWSPDGGRLLFSYEGTLYAADIATGERTALGPLSRGDYGYTWGPDCSPDGSKIVFDDEGSIYEMRIDGAERSPLLQSEGNCVYSHPRYSPTGERIAFTRYPLEEETLCPTQVCLMALDRSEVTCLHSGSDPVWSPDGRNIAFLDGGGIRVMNADGSEVRWLVPSQQWWYSELDWGR